MKQIINVFILTTVLFITGTTSFAQEPDGQADAVQYDFSTFTINGFEVAGPEYTEQDIIRVFGQPDSVGYEFGKSYLYERKTSWFHNMRLFCGYFFRHERLHSCG